MPTSTEARAAKLRSFFAEFVCRKGAVADERVREAFAHVPREPFAGPGPWMIVAGGPWRARPRTPAYLTTPDDDPAFLYQDVLVALDAARGINIGEPSLHAHCLDALAVAPDESVLQVGAGSGYYTAILAHLVGSKGRVTAFEIDPALADRAARNLQPWPQALIEPRSGVADGLPEADAIYVNAGVVQPSWAWIEALRPGGRLLFPLQPEDGWGGMLLIRKPVDGGTAWPARFVSRASFIACQTRQDSHNGRELAAAFRTGDFEAVRAFRFDDRRDASCWFDGGDWWLSTSEP